MVPGGQGRRARKSSLKFGSNGMATLVPRQTEHPIYELMEAAETRWTHLLASQSTALPLAVEEYKRRYGLDPPAGFDKWFDFCQRNGIRIVDEYDQMMKDLLPHHALPPDAFIKRSGVLQEEKFTYTLTVRKDKVELTGERKQSARPIHIRDLIEGFREDLPDDFELKVTGSDHDFGSVILGRDQRERAMQLVKEGQCELRLGEDTFETDRWTDFDEAELARLEDPHRTSARGWFVGDETSHSYIADHSQKACPLDSPANIRPGAENTTNEIFSE